MSTTILSIDGGGMRGILSIRVLIELEKCLRLYSGNKQAHLADYFDLIAGTSTGSILTAILLCPGEGKKPKYDATDALNMYVRHGKEIFKKRAWPPFHTLFRLFGSKYINRNFQALLNEYFGETTLQDLYKPCLLTAYDTSTRKTIFLNSVSSRKSKDRNLYLKDAVLASSAAPTYFPPVQTNKTNCLIDGGVVANNPSLCALIEAVKLPGAKEIKDTYVLSIGNVSSPKPYAYQKVKHWGLIEWAVPMFHILMDASEETVDYQLRKLYENLGIPNHYVRIDYRTDQIVPPMDAVSVEDIKCFQRLGETLVKMKEKEIQAYAKILIEQKK